MDFQGAQCPTRPQSWFNKVVSVKNAFKWEHGFNLGKSEKTCSHDKNAWMLQQQKFDKFLHCFHSFLGSSRAFLMLCSRTFHVLGFASF